MKEAVDPTSYDDQKPLMTWDFGNRHCAIDLIGACRNVWTWVVTPSLEIPAKLFSLATGRNTSEADLLFAAQRVKTLERAFLVIKGIRRKDDSLPKRLFEMKVPGGMFKGETLDKQKLDKMIDKYYQLRGWDEDGIPTEETFNKFGLSSELKLFKKRMDKQVAFTS
jgi:aldehyde:ferredoxin oxidoreductase